MLQVKYADSLIQVENKLNGKWKYLGKRYNDMLIDTMKIILNTKKSFVTVENGVVFEHKRKKKRKADYFYRMDVNFRNRIGTYSLEEISLTDYWIALSSSQPLIKIVYFDKKIGILFIAHSGSWFRGIIKLTATRLVLENREEYVKLN
jgi:hypothetical protein